MQRGRGRGGHGRQKQPRFDTASALRVTVFLDQTKRGFVVGAQGATVKNTQKETGALINTPKRGVDGPTVISGPDALSVLRACCMVARQTGACSECACSVAGAPELRATLLPTSAGQYVLFSTAEDALVAFAAYCFPRSASSDVEDARSRLDDECFAAGSGQIPCWVMAAGTEIFLYGMDAGAAVAKRLCSQLAPLVARPVAAAPSESELAQARDAPCPTSAQHGAWHAVLLSGDLATGGSEHGLVGAALQGKLGLGPAAKPLCLEASGGVELYLVDRSLLEQLDVIRARDRQERVEASVGMGSGRMQIAWVYGPKE